MIVGGAFTIHFRKLGQVVAPCAVEASLMEASLHRLVALKLFMAFNAQEQNGDPD